MFFFKKIVKCGTSKGFMKTEGLYKNVLGTTRKCGNKNSSFKKPLTFLIF